ncbi:class II fructose-bisphosphate aldolase [Arthrobacter sp. 24S4-2]|uniref:class II fructose-bisphosphate aldolase n=1 Tax=Arthrobacter sp. 24S4-2 TaxID=2575374 RepID=UPI0010C77436|nr:class II fructose-bisphosphate aldolase [Arthrobacter sp. 24S4-2]QCO96640.1 class II fructose-bisphosphate aldolase [Arthrobacter sp. 24S4-2]
MRARLDHLVVSALQQGSAVPAFTCYDFTTALAVVDAAEEAGRGAILLVAPKTAATPNGLRLITALRGLADTAAVPIAVQLDHASDLQLIADAVAAGADSVLADGSARPYEENISLVREARAVLDAQGHTDVVIEAELGGLAGDEDRAFGAGAEGSSPADTDTDTGADTGTGTGARTAGLTDSAQVEDFVARTGAQLLAVAVGNVHGKYKGEPQLRWDALQDIAVRTHIPLVLHGASGIPAGELVKAASMNVGKVNFNTELRTGVLATLEGHTPAHRADGENLRGLLLKWNASAKTFAAGALAMLTR